ncbi:MAG: HAD hydrolase family protein [Candidatus Omnitrophica bacterium]|nr:HAD hydrolase family protein [Candidatus Omnitrophota bacterium]MCM8769575.1 HAD hydrolase family protein [Candidatus Omnitrophota bacterium]
MISEESWHRIKVLAVDVDGVLTDGQIILQGNSVCRRFYVRDGLAIKWLVQLGLRVVIITGRNCTLAEKKRWHQLGIRTVLARAENKEKSLGRWLKHAGFNWNDVCYIGDDLPDRSPMQRAALAVCPADACPQVRAVADIVCHTSGGCGVLREIAELILQKRGKWETILASYASC